MTARMKRRRTSNKNGAAPTVLLSMMVAFQCAASFVFVPLHINRHAHRQRSPQSVTTCRRSSVGGEDNDDNSLNEWIGRKESEDVRNLRESFSETRLPINYEALNTDNESSNQFGPKDRSNDTTVDATASEDGGGKMSTVNRVNPYLNVVSRLAPSDLIARFTSTASPRIQDAVRTTVLGLIGGLPQMAFETKTIATGERLASLMFQLQMTGYMFKNAEYRLSLSQSLGKSDRMLPSASGGDNKAWRDGKKLSGKIKVKYGGGISVKQEGADDKENEGILSVPGLEVEVDAQAYMAELRGEVERLRDELDATKQAKEEKVRQDLLLYVRTLPQQELRELTSTMSPEVLEAMKGLITAMLAGIGDSEQLGEGGGGNKTSEDVAADGNGNNIGPGTVTEQSGEALAQLCMWQLVVGFNLRELEVRAGFDDNFFKDMSEDSSTSYE